MKNTQTHHAMQYSLQHNVGTRHGSVNRKTEPISDILKTDTDVGISKTEKNENRQKITEKTDTVGYFPISRNHSSVCVYNRMSKYNNNNNN